MKITESIEPSRGKMTTHLLSIRISPNLRTALLFAAAFAFGAAGWSGKPSLNFLALLYPFVYLQSRRRLDAFSSALYYAGATWSVIPGSESFFGTGGNLVLPLLIWTALLALECGTVDCFLQSSVSSCGDRRGHRRTEPAPAQPRHGCTSAHLCGPVVSWNSMVRALSAT